MLKRKFGVLNRKFGMLKRKFGVLKKKILCDERNYLNIISWS